MRNIYRHLEMGQDAARRPCSESARSARGDRATISILDYLPAGSGHDGTIGKLFFQFGVTVASGHASLGCALTLTPMCEPYYWNWARRCPSGPPLRCRWPCSSGLLATIEARTVACHPGMLTTEG